ncbi:MAG: hypothetical protein JNJ54_29145 [Myxococcaceae bacterium]|nr:hypothetical protein [Myxococcaceae bacterium]
MARLVQRAVISRSALALGLVALELLVVGHMAFERHTVSTSGSVVELHASLDLHAHEDRSLCERDGDDLEGPQDTLCQGTPETLTRSTGEARDASAQALQLARGRLPEVHRSGVAVWRTAPKASPPALG